ncbi:hypothetical protein GXN76_13150 [Kroppenstedtia pulmonis]|uniref:Uncharacterized protein n=1 Tax=Kroppenstedtia pulmonis TaxID=1380685 RepID=A0A7D4B3G1_9BACL|nr:hypothetical protein [Kroppenstedtia pulmonis]QKG85326.1 hypothetical protein GXN76_13150 [Kroppenstedtia pulmonis]
MFPYIMIAVGVTMGTMSAIFYNKKLHDGFRENIGQTLDESMLLFALCAILVFLPWYVMKLLWMLLGLLVIYYGVVQLPH